MGYITELLRIGKVTSIDVQNRTVRVLFPDVNIVSGWLKVIKSPPFIPKKGTEQCTEKESGGSGESAFSSHSHKVKISPWIPDIGDTVLCIYNSGFNDDGYVLGAL